MLSTKCGPMSKPTDYQVQAIIKDRNAWKTRALRAEELLKSCRELSVQRADELLKLREELKEKNLP